jgi:hypothetical protein
VSEIEPDPRNGSLARLGHRVVSALPGPFLALVVLNAIVIAGLVYEAREVSQDRAAVLTELIRSCAGVEQSPHSGGM